MNIDQNYTNQSDENENRVASKLMIDRSLSSCSEHPELPLTRLSFDYFPSQPASSIIRFKCEKCCLFITNNLGIFFRSKWFEFKEFINNLLLEEMQEKIESIAFQQFQENLYDKLDKTDRTTLLPIADQTDQMYNPEDVRNAWDICFKGYKDPIYEINPVLCSIAFESFTNLEDKQKYLENFSEYYKRRILFFEESLMDLIKSHRQLKYLPELQPPPKLSKERFQTWPEIFGENQANLFKRLLAQSDSIKNLTIDLRGLNQFLKEEDFADVAAILAHMTSLKRLNLSLPYYNLKGNYHIVARGIAQVKNLTHLELNLEFREEFSAMIGSLKYLEHLKLQPLNSLLVLDFYDIKLAFFHSNQLKTLDVKIIDFNQNSLNSIKLNTLISAITQQTQLVELNLEIKIMKIEDSGFICFEEMFQKLKFLEKLKLRFMILETKAEAIKILIGSLVHLHKLTHLRVNLFEFSEVVLGSLNIVLQSLKQLKSLCLTLKDSNENNKSWNYAIQGKPTELLRLGFNLSQLKNLEIFKLFFLSNRLNLDDQKLFAETILHSTRDQINFSSLKVCLITYFENRYQNILSQQFVNQIQQIEKLTFLNLHFHSNMAIQIFETLARMAHLRHLKVQITQESECESCLTAIQSSIEQLTQLSSFKLTIMDSDLRDMSLIPLIESIQKLQNNLFFFQFQLRNVKWRNLRKCFKLLSRKFKLMRKLTTLKIELV